MREKSAEAAEAPASLISLDSLRQAREMPWKASNELRRWLIWPLAWWSLRGADVGVGWRCYGRPIFQRHRKSIVRIGRRMELRSTPASNPLGPNHPVIISTRRAGAALTIGDDFGMTGGSLVCDQRISIGDRVWVGANTVIADTDFHPLNPDLRRARPLEAKTGPVTHRGRRIHRHARAHPEGRVHWVALRGRGGQRGHARRATRHLGRGQSSGGDSTAVMLVLYR